MRTEHTLCSLRGRLQQWRMAGESVALVPTMGNLHAGHLALVKQAQQQADRVVVTIFVNPTQFGVGEDFSSYPRTLERDTRLLTQAEVDLLFAPGVEQLYPGGQCDGTYVEVPGLSGILCGASRPGHFRGVATVVTKLFNAVQPDIALFGEKDYQQLLVIRRMTRELCLPVDIIAVPTVRESDGLALSSRNGYLTEEQRERAPLLYKSLLSCKEQIFSGKRDYASLVSQAEADLLAAGFEPDYFEVRRADNLAEPTIDTHELVILAAARLGRTRLIDNISFSL
ncbi:MAG TPA: pantoate--beta-alanine ligase [Gammaproteobacteria bacterium]|nr:pantoate--beta-alanine ligase [Gammaproteobacteria bacterium]